MSDTPKKLCPELETLERLTLETGLPIRSIIIISAIAVVVIILIIICCVCIYNYEPFKNNRFGSQGGEVELAQDDRPDISIKRA